MYPFEAQWNKMQYPLDKVQLYFLALIPPPDIQSLIIELKLIFLHEYQASHALNSPPHITVIPPFSMPKIKRAFMHDFFEKNLALIEPTKITLDGFGCFSPKVIFIQPDLPASLLLARRSLVARFYHEFLSTKPDTKHYHPHLTLAFKDLSPEMFHKAWTQFSTREFHETFIADALFLLKYEGGRWEVYRQYPFDKQHSVL